jgi:hypothetical protein
MWLGMDSCSSRQALEALPGKFDRELELRKTETAKRGPSFLSTPGLHSVTEWLVLLYIAMEQ